MINKVIGSVREALADIPDGAVVAIGGFGWGGWPYNLVLELAKRKVRNLVGVGNSPRQFLPLLNVDGHCMLRKIISSYPIMKHGSRSDPLAEYIQKGELEVEGTTMGTLVERLRAGGAGIPAFYTPVGAGTEVEAGKEKRIFDSRECIMEYAIKLDYALIKAHKGDRLGNLVYRHTSRNYNPVMAMAAKITIAQVDNIVDVSELDPESIVTPGVFVHRVVAKEVETPVEWIEQDKQKIQEAERR